MTKCLFTLAVALTLSSPAFAGVRVVFAEEIRTKGAKQPGFVVRRIDIDGSRFRIASPEPNPVIETSLDDGATTFLGSDRTKTQSPLARDKNGHLGPLTFSVEDEKITVGAPHPGPAICGVATQTYAVDQSRVLVTRVMGLARRRDRATDHYELSVGDIGASPAAVRVLLSRGYGMSLASHAEAFRGFPLRIVGHLVEGEGTTTDLTTDFRLEAVSIEAWSWPDGH